MEKNPKAAKIYTKTGDRGQTSLLGGQRVSKADPRLEAYGTIDELNSVVGILIAELNHEGAAKTKGAPSHELDNLGKALRLIQSLLFDVGSRLACEDATLRGRLPDLDEADIAKLEAWMDEYTERLPALKNFILPGGSRSGAHAHLARTVCRRAERLCVALNEKNEVEDRLIRFLNRLSDYFFVLARHLNHLMDAEEIIWSAKTR